jgi:Domain of unknown function (DUF4136)
MTRSNWILASLLLLLLVSSASSQKVAVGYDHAADFSKIKTYTWTKGVPAKNPDIDSHIISSVEKQLAAKGLTKVNEGGDMLISYHAAVMPDFEQVTVARPGTWGPRTGSTDAAWQVVRGSLILEMVNPSTKQELWRGSATDTLSNEGPTIDVAKNLDKSKKKVTKVVEKLLKYYPPKSSK